MIALATGFDSITGGLKDMEIIGIGGELMSDKWAKGTWTYLGLTTARFPNFFLYVVDLRLIAANTPGLELR